MSEKWAWEHVRSFPDTIAYHLHSSSEKSYTLSSERGCLMNDRDALVPLSEADEAVSAYFIENPIAMRSVIQMMPEGDPTLDFLQKLWSYAATRNRKVDLANALLYYDKRTNVPWGKHGRGWYCDCHLPCDSPEMFWEVQKFSWVRDDDNLDDYEDFDEVDAVLSWMMYIKEMVGDGIVDMENTLKRIRRKRNAILRAEQMPKKNAETGKTDDKPRLVCLLKIHQKYCDKILSGEKTYEYRKRCPEWIVPGSEMVLCSSGEPAVLLAVFEVGKIITGTPEEVWEQTCKADGVDRDEFFAGYYKNEPQAVAFEVLNARPLSVDKTVASVFGKDYSASSFKRLSDEEIAKVKELMWGV